MSAHPWRLGLKNNDSFEECQLNEVPDTAIEAASRDLIDYSVGFVRVESTLRGPKDVTLLGSGILVSVGTTHAVLTAHHVLSALPRSGRLGLLLAPTMQQYTIDIQGVAYIEIARGTRDADGPDLGAAILAPSIASAIGTMKTYNLDSRRDRMLHAPPDLHDGFWFVNGFVDENTIDERVKDGYGWIKRFYNLSGAGGPQKPILVGGYDYFDFPVSFRGRAFAPKSFGGMSGGGLWQIPLIRDTKGQIKHKKPLLSGIVFYQEPTTDRFCGVKCHGRLSVYDVAFKAIQQRRP